MRKILATMIIACAATFALSACDQKDKTAATQAEQAPQVAPMPTNATDKTAWKKYLVSVVTANMTGVKTNHPYMYFVPSGDAQDVQDARQSQLDNVSGTVSRGVLPGNMLAFGGPDSKLTGDLVVEAFKSAGEGSFKGVIVLFVGAPADQDRVKAAVAKSGAEFRFVEMK